MARSLSRADCLVGTCAWLGIMVEFVVLEDM